MSTAAKRASSPQSAGQKKPKAKAKPQLRPAVLPEGLKGSSTTPAEMPALLARSTWEEARRCSTTIHFTDNSSVKEALDGGFAGFQHNLTRQTRPVGYSAVFSLGGRWWHKTSLYGRLS
eukprot:823325-Amphidinium_carterae.1